MYTAIATAYKGDYYGVEGVSVGRNVCSADVPM